MSAAQDIVVDLVLPSGESLGPSSVPVSHTAALIVAEMVEAFSLPPSIDGRNVDYQVFWEQQGQVIPLNQTLSEAGVQAGHRLQLRAPVEVPAPDPGAGGGLGGFVSADEKTIPVTIEFFIDNYSREPAHETLVYDDTVRSVIDRLTKQLDLPRTMSGRPAVYKLRSKALGAELGEAMTLRQLHVPKHDSLKLAAERPAG
jgi:hypothetical protein